MSTSERFSLRPSAEEWRHAWVARGELRDQRFELPPALRQELFEALRDKSSDTSPVEPYGRAGQVPQGRHTLDLELAAVADASAITAAPGVHARV